MIRVLNFYLGDSYVLMSRDLKIFNDPNTSYSCNSRFRDIFLASPARYD